MFDDLHDLRALCNFDIPSRLLFKVFTNLVRNLYLSMESLGIGLVRFVSYFYIRKKFLKFRELSVVGLSVLKK